MKLPLSIHARQIVIAVVAGMVALMVSWQANKSVLDLVITTSLNDKMDAQLGGIERAVDADGRLHPDRILLLPDYDLPTAGWGWDVRTVAGHWHKGPRPAQSAYADGTIQVEHGAYSGRGWKVDGTRVHLRQRRSGTPEKPVIVTVIAPDSLIKAPIRHALIPTISALVLLALILALTALLQVHFGLKPVRRLQTNLADIRNGTRQLLPEAQPGELKPLAAEINALISQQELSLNHARQHMANLAHGVKTPLATLAFIMTRDAGNNEEVRSLVAAIDNRVAHHLRRARSAAISGAPRLRCDAWQITTDLILVLQQLHGQKAIRVRNDLPQPCQLAVDAEDFGEILGNLLENAFRHCREAINVTGTAAEGRHIRIVVEDDGSGITDMLINEAMLPGRRLDETGKGYGLGLNITRELVELYNGSIDLAQSPNLGGLSCTITLPLSLKR
ncbi:HAMP domain-containing sensor histidine kinase [Novosphingobium sp. BL-8A]|uniref:sensor histidine kinase n=1 Tax=Novosphingobium sp. BL-8A TaxID=3127639 RepID=UPI003758212F